MKKKICVSLGLLVLLTGLVIANILIHGSGAEEMQSPPAQIPDPSFQTYMMTDQNPSDITSLTITNEYGIMDLAKDRNTGFWNGASQFIGLDQHLVRVMAVDFVMPIIGPRFSMEAAGGLAEYGLDPPLRTVEARYADNTSDTLHIGRVTPDGQHYYARMLGNDQVYLIRNIIGDRYLWTYNDIVTRDINVIEPDSLINVILARDGCDDIILVPNFAAGLAEGIHPDRAFAMNSGLMMYAPLQGRSVRMRNFTEFVMTPAANIRLHALADLSIENPELYGLDTPVLELIFIYADFSAERVGNALPQSFWRFRAGNPDGNGEYYYVLYDGIPHIFTVPREMIEPLLAVDFLSFTERFVRLVNIGTVHSIRIESPGEVYDIFLNHGDTVLDDSAAPDISPEVNGRQVPVRDFISFYQLLVGITYEQMIEPFIPENAPELTVTFNIYAADGSASALTNYYYPFNNSFYAVTDEGEAEARLLISRQALNHMLRYLDMLLD
ncbi:MAG: DUF4340 domain-containing protein [Defluviitaleaceae bacterium]|nr:DUF4340 domain-containing protein [Defluviitaleaceae bacterium]